MVWPLPLPSVRQQWNQYTHAVIPAGNWGPGHHTFAMDNGDIIQIVSHWNDSQYSETDVGLALICRVFPEGNERLSADATRDGIEFGDTYNYFMFPMGSPQWTGSGDIREWPLADDWDTWYGDTDGEVIYIFNEGHCMWFRFDPSTFQLEHIAGAYQEDANVDSSVGLNARFQFVTSPKYKDGYIYFMTSDFENFIGKMKMRRMSTTAPYGVSTVFSFENPAGAPTDNTTNYNAWLGQTNPSTGLLNAFNPDQLAPSTWVPSAFYGDYFYYFVDHTMNPWSTSEFARIDMDTGLKQVLIYGIEREEALHETRDLTTNLAPTPNGALLNGFENNRIPGTGDITYEGMNGGANTAVVVDGKFITNSDHISIFSSGDQVYASTIIAIDIPKLLLAVEANDNRPIRHDRQNPFWDTIANGTCPHEMFNGYNYANRRRHFEHRDGATPTLSHVLWQGGFATGNPGTQWEGKVVYATSYVGYAFIGNSNNNGMAIKILEPPGNASFKARVVFEGTHLKGYANVENLQRVGPVEVVLW